MNDPRYRSSFGFIDLLFNMLIGFVFLFMLAFLLINPVAKKETIKPKAEYFIELEWDGEKNLVFVTHFVVISEIFNIGVSSGEMIVSDKNYKIFGNINVLFFKILFLALQLQLLF